MWSPIKGHFILLSDEQAAKYNGFENEDHRFFARSIGDGHHIVGANVLENPAYAPIIPELMTLPQCKIQERWEGEQTQIIRIKPRSIFNPDNSPRVYSPPGQDFARPPFPPRGDWSADVLYASIGRSLSSWERVEVSLADLFSALLSPSIYPLPAQRAFGSIATSKGRIDMLREAGFAVFMASPDDLASARFDALLSRASKFAARRNEIAHGIVGDYSAPDGPVRGLALLPPRYATSKYGLVPHSIPEVYPPTEKPNYAYTSSEISFFSGRFYKIYRDVHELSYYLYREFSSESVGT